MEEKDRAIHDKGDGVAQPSSPQVSRDPAEQMQAMLAESQQKLAKARLDLLRHQLDIEAELLML